MATKKKKVDSKPKNESADPVVGDRLDEVLASIKAGLTMPEVAQMTGFHVETLRKWSRGGQLKTFKVGNVVRVHRSDLAEFLATRSETK